MLVPSIRTLLVALANLCCDNDELHELGHAGGPDFFLAALYSSAVAKYEVAVFSMHFDSARRPFKFAAWLRALDMLASVRYELKHVTKRFATRRTFESE